MQIKQLLTAVDVVQKFDIDFTENGKRIRQLSETDIENLLV